MFRHLFSPSPGRWRGWLIALAALMVVLGGGYVWLIHAAKEKLRQGLAERGLFLKTRHQTWSLWGGITLKEAVLCQLSGHQKPLLAISALQVDLLWREAWQAKAAVSRWRTQDATLTLSNAAGAETLTRFSTDFILRKATIDLTRLDASHGAVNAAVTGQILLAAAGPAPAGPFQINLKPLRAGLEILRVRPDTGSFNIAGSFLVDLRNPASVWNSELRGTGQQVEWRGLPMRTTVIDAQLSQSDLKVSCDIKLEKGIALLDVTREGWSEIPVQISGTLTDSSGQADTFRGQHDAATQTLSIEQLTGRADLLELTRNFPPVADRVPAALTVKTFPDLDVREWVWRGGETPPDWSLSSVKLRTPAAVVVQVRDHPVTIDDLSGSAAYERRAWRFEGVAGRLLGGRFGLDANYDGRILSKTRLSLQGLRPALLSPWLEQDNAKLDESTLSLTYQGTICHDPVRSTGTGSLVLTDAPVVNLPLLDQAYALFPNLLPRPANDGTGEFQADFAMNKGVAEFDPFQSRSDSLTITATGIVDLVKRQVEGKARANLRGIVGVATAPLSHVLAEMRISGPLDDIRVSPLGPTAVAKTAITATAKTAGGAAGGSVQLSSGLIREALTLPFEAFGLLGKD